MLIALKSNFKGGGGWKGRWMDGWMGGRAGLRIVYSNKKLLNLINSPAAHISVVYKYKFKPGRGGRAV